MDEMVKVPVATYEDMVRSSTLLEILDSAWKELPSYRFESVARAILGERYDSLVECGETQNENKTSF